MAGGKPGNGHNKDKTKDKTEDPAESDAPDSP